MTKKIRAVAAVFLSFACLVTLTSAFNLPNRPTDSSRLLSSVRTFTKPAQHRTSLTFADRVTYQRAIEEVYWRHRIWPKERPDPKPSLAAIMSQAQLEKKVEDYLRNSQALEDYWQRPITPDELQAEMERMATHTKQPEVLRELFEALGNDPLVIAECLARPALSERLVTNLYAHDERFHGELKQRAEADLQTHRDVQQMKQTSGKYSEVEWVKSDGGQDDEKRGGETGLKLNSSEWDETVQKLEATFGETRIAQIKTGVLSPLQEDEGRYYATAELKETKYCLKLVTVEWRKEPLESWRARAERQTPKVTAATSANYTLPTISGEVNGCTDNTWTATSTTNAPTARYSHTAIWTGSEMIVWGGYNGTDFNTGGRYNPSTDSWTATSTTNAPTARSGHTAIWTGSEMIVWGGLDVSGHFFNTGGRYNPSTDSWTATSTTNAPFYRAGHTAVWTGSQMIVWGGVRPPGALYLNTGGRYNPSTDSWTATSTINAPTARGGHTAVWTGSQMIVWGGIDSSSNYVNTGGRYSPGTDSWTATSTINAPTARGGHTAVWTGSQTIVWGGQDHLGNYVNTGGRYDPGTDLWTVTSTTNAPSGRYLHTAVWTGGQMIVWGGSEYPPGIFLNTGGRYTPDMDSWTASSTTNAPSGRDSQTTVWTGSEMIVWGGEYNSDSSYLNTGGRYCGQLSGTGPPIVTTNLATNVASSFATLNGSLNPRGLTTTIYFQYGPTADYGFTTPTQTQTGNTYRNISANITGLIASHIYHFRIVAHNSDGTIYGNDVIFTTLSATGVPVVTTGTATNFASFSATLNGSLDPHGLSTSEYFQYGTTINYGFTTVAHTQTGNTFRNVSANIGGLNASTVYHFRIVAHNSDGTSYGSDRTFTTLSPTGSPIVATNAATNVASSSATLNGSLDPHGLITAVHFQYGATTSYGSTTAAQSQTGNTYRTISANIGGLSASHTYHFRIVATNSAGTRYGSDRIFITTH